MPLLAFATFFRDGVRVFETETLGLDEWNPQTKALPVRLLVASGQLEPGSYEC